MHTLTSAPGRTAIDAKLVLHVVCHEWLVAVDTERIERVALEDTFAPRAEQLSGAPRGYLGVLRADGREYAAWDLATLVGREPQRGAWVFFGGHDAHSDLPIALRTGSCRTVGRLLEAGLSSLPRGMCGHERRPFRSAFLPTAAQMGSAKHVVAGLVLDLERLFLRPELDWSRRVSMERRRKSGP